MLSSIDFAKTIIIWQRQHGRHNLPWQGTESAYQVLVSELMLQQTQVSTVIPYFNNWLEKFPSLEHLAEASEDEVMANWQGLGYYARARNLHKAAKFIRAEHAGKVPEQPELLREVPGIGPYTAGAIRAFAYNQPAAIVDGNIKRLFCRYFGVLGDPNKAATNKELWQLAEQYKPQQDNRTYAQGLLDLGATICTPRAPKCEQCPLAATCNALQTNRVHELPQRAVKRKIPTREGWFLLDINEAGVALQQRSGEGIWPKLWCLPELTEAPTASPPIDGHFKHSFSHYRLAATVFKGCVTDQHRRVPLDQLQQFGLPTPIRKYLQKKL